MAFRSSLRHHTLRSADVLPLYDSVFAVAFTLLAFNLPERLEQMMGADQLLQSIRLYTFTAAAVAIYWFKLRRLILIDRYLQSVQLGLVGLALLTVVMIPKFAVLVLRYGEGAGSLLHWTRPQLVNTLALVTLLLFNLLCVLYARGLRRRRAHRLRNPRLLDGVIRTQTLGMLALLLLVMEMAFAWFDNDYIYLLPVILLIEEWLVARRLILL